MMNIFDVANYFIAMACCDEDCGEAITNLKLQKLCYYAQGFYLAMYNAPLFKDEIEAWQHGPVIPELYQKYKKQKFLDIDKNFNIDDIPIKVKNFLDRVYQVYGQFSAWKLRDMTHEEDPWKSVFNLRQEHIIISQESMKKFFLTRIE